MSGCSSMQKMHNLILHVLCQWSYLLADEVDDGLGGLVLLALGVVVHKFQ